MSDLITQARAALESEHSSEALEAMFQRVKARIHESIARHDTICSEGDRIGNVRPPQPTARQRVIDAGDLSEIKKLDDEAQALKSEVEILRSLQGRLRKRWDETKAQEYVDGAAQTYASVGQLMDAKREADEVARKAGQALDAKMQEIRQQRDHVTRQSLHGCRLEFPAAEPELLRQYMAVRGYTYHRGPQQVGWFAPGANPHNLANIAAALGLEKPGPESEAQAA